MRPPFIICVLLLFGRQGVLGQGLPNFCGVHQKALPTNSLPQSNTAAPYTDRFGNIYTAKDLNVYNYSNLQLHYGGNNCPDNYFTLAFNDAGGAFSAAETATIKQVFCDLSHIITAADGVNNVLIGISKNSTLSAAATATPLFENTCGITQPLIWEKINSTSGQYPIGFAFGLIDINPIPAPGLTWYNGDGTGIGLGQLDLYSVVLHEALHVLGFASLIDLDGIPEDGNYSRWDTYLYSNPQNDYLIQPSNTNANCCNEHAFNDADFTMPTSLNGDCPLQLYFRGGGANIASVNYIGNGDPTSDNAMRNKLSHLAGSCDGNAPYVMQGLGEGQLRRNITPEELNILCKLGYTISSGESCSNDCVILPADDNYTLVLSNANTLIIEVLGDQGVLKNDIVTTSSGATISLVNGCGNMGGAVSYSDVTHKFTVTAPPGITPGMYSFCYALTGCENWCGQATVNVLVINDYIPTECNDANCNLACFGDFEAFIPLSDAYSTFSPYYEQLGLDFYDDEYNYANYPIFEPWMPTPDVYAYNGDNYILSIIGNSPAGYSTEDVYLPLSEAVAPNCAITVSFYANTECHDQNVTYQFFALNNAFVDMNGIDCGEIPNFYATMMCNTASTAICPNVTATCMTANCVVDGVSAAYPCGIPINNDSPAWDGNAGANGSYNPNLGISSHRSFTWTNNTSDPITHLIILPTIQNIVAGTWINAYLDNVVVTSDCHPNISVQSEPVSACAGNQTSIEYTVCINSDDTSPASVSLQATLPISGVTFANGGNFDATGAATVTVTPGTCATLTLNLQVGNSFAGNVAYPVYMNASASNYCYDGNSIGQTTQLNIAVCDPLEMCLNQNLDSYLAFSASNAVVSYGTAGATANYTSPGDVGTAYTDWTPTSNPFGNAAIVRINGDLIIDATSEIRMIGMHFQFGPLGRIIVKRNARLIIQGGTFESGSSCMWQGIQVWGPGEDVAQTANNTGFLSFEVDNIAALVTISDAVIGVATTRLDIFDFATINTALTTNDFGGTPYALNNSAITILPNINAPTAHSFGGGSVFIKTGLNINNCFYGALIAHYNQTPLILVNNNAPYVISGGNFTTTGNLLPPFNTLTKGEAGVCILNFTTAKVTISSTQFSNLTYGIRGNNAQKIDIKGSQFTNCTRAISAQMSMNGITPLCRVQNNTITDCEIGIQADALNIAITDNTINGTGINDANSVGIFLRGSNFLVGSVNADISNITGNPAAPPLTLPGNIIEDANIGIAIMDNGGYSNQINNNNIRNVQTAIHAIRLNPSIDIHCNALNFVTNGIALQSWGLVNGDLDDQGNCLAGYPAHNTFAHLSSTFTDLFKDGASDGFNYDDIGYNALVKSTGITGNECIYESPPCNQPQGMSPITGNDNTASKTLSKQVLQYQIDSNLVAAQQLLEQNTGLAVAARKLIQHYYETENYATAHNMLDAMSLAKQEDQQFYTLHKLALALKQEGKSWQQANDAQIATLLQIANSQTTVAYQAQAMLYQARGYEFPVIIPQLPNTGLQYGATVFKTDNANGLVQPFVPNPTTGTTQLAYSLPIDAQAVLTLTDISGKVQQRVLLIGNGIYDLDTRPLSDGLYLYTVQQNGNVLLRHKLVVIK